MNKLVRLLAATFALLVMISIAGRVQAAPALKGQDTFKLEPGGTATIIFESFCIDYGKKFPTAVGLPPTTVADANVVGAINYALSKDYTTSAAKEVQFAIWQARGAQGSPATGTQGDEVTKNATMTMAAPAGATSIIDALKDNRLKATAGTWSGIGDKVTIGTETSNFQGRGELKIENASQETLTLYMPNGTVFPAPAAEFQSMAGYLTDVQVSNPQRLPDTGMLTMDGTSLMLLGMLAVSIAALGWAVRREAMI